MRLLDRFYYLLVLCWRGALRHRRRSMLVISTAAVGMTGVLFSMGFSNGMMDSMISGSIESGMGHVQIRPEGFKRKRKVDSRLQSPEELLSEIKALPYPSDLQPVHVAGRFEREGLLRIGSYQEGVVVTGINPETEKDVSSFDNWITDGSYLPPRERNTRESDAEAELGIIPCLIGRINADRMEVEVGDYVILTVGNAQSESVSIRAEIVGIFESPMTGVDRHTVLVRRSDLSQLYASGSDEMSNITILGPDLSRSGALDQFVESRLAQNHRVHDVDSPDLADPNAIEVLSFFQLQPQIEIMLDYIDQIKGIIYAVLMSGFALTLLNSVLMSVFERTREIGIQRAIGTRKSFIIASIIIESLILAFGGAIAGLIVGGGLVLTLSVTGLPLQAFAGGIEMMGSMGTVIYPRITFEDISMGFYVSIIMSILASIYPAYKATSIQPVEAIANR